MGFNSGASGAMNISGTAAFSAPSRNLTVGYNGHGEIDQTGGSISAERIFLGQAASGDGTYTISGGSVDVNSYIYLNYGDSSMTVEGSGADHIRTKRFILAGNTMNIDLDADGATLIEVNGTAADAARDARVNGTWNIGTLAGFDGTEGDTYDILWAANDITDTSGFNLVNADSTEFEWSILDNVASDGTVGTGKMLQVTVIPEPATLGMFAFMGGGLFWIRRRFMI